MNDNINLNLLRQFIIVAESKNLSSAAEKLGYSESNISVNISTLEKQLGVKLFTRKPLKLTDIGKEIYDNVKTGFEDINFAMTIAESKNSIEHGKISIGCPSHISQFFLMERIEKAIKDYPNLQINLETEADNKDVIQLLKSGKIDFAILGPTSNEYSYELEVQKIKSTDNIFISKEEIIINNMEELNNYKYILPYGSKRASKKLNEILKKYNVKLHTILECPTTEPRVDAAKRGIGIAYVVRDAAKKELDNKEVYELKMPIELPSDDINIVYVKNHLTKVDKEFIKKYIRIQL